MKRMIILALLFVGLCGCDLQLLANNAYRAQEYIDSIGIILGLLP